MASAPTLPISGASASRARFGATRKEARRACKAAVAAQRDYDDAMAREQEKLVRSISKMPAAERPLTILLTAHPYVSHDPFVGGVVEDALREQGACVLFADEADKARSLKKSYEFSHSIPWIVKRELIGATLLLHEHIDGIVLMSAYPCGPDSMCDDAMERCIKGKPILTLTVDAQAVTARPARSFSLASAPSATGILAIRSPSSISATTIQHSNTSPSRCSMQISFPRPRPRAPRSSAGRR